MTDKTETMAAMLDGNVDAIAAKLPDMDLATLKAVRAAEEAGKTRSTLMAAIDKRIGELGDTEDAGDGAAAAQTFEVLELQKLQAGIEALGYSFAVLSDDETTVDKALLIVTGVQLDRDHLASQIKALADEILVLDLRGTEDGGACDIAAIRLQELVALKAENERLSDQIAHAPSSPPSDNVLVLPADLSGMPLGTLDAFRIMTVEAGLEGETERVDAALAALRDEAVKAPTIDAGSTETRVIAKPAALDAIKAGPTHVAFADGLDPIDGIAPIEVSEASFHIVGGRPVLNQVIRIAGDVEPGRITHANLLAGDLEDYDVVGVCEIAGGLQVGGGRHAEFPAGSLIF